MVKRIDTLTALDEGMAEEAAGEPITNIEEEDAPKVRIYCALAWVIKRREEPTLSFDEYLRTHRFRDALSYVFGDDADVDGAEGSDEGAEEAAAAADPFPEGAAPQVAAVAADAAGAEGPVLSGDGDQPV